MSFLGLSRASTAARGTALHRADRAFDFYFEADTIVTIGKNYQHYMIGQAQWDQNSPDIQKALEQARGTFCYVLFQADLVTVGTDAMSFYPLFYTPGTRANFANTIPHLKHRLPKLTINWDSSGFDRDTLVAKQLAQLLKITEHTTLSMPPETTVQAHKAYKDYWTGFESHEHEWASNMIGHLPSQSLIYDGIVGDVTVSNGYQIIAPSYITIMRNPQALVEKMYLWRQDYQLKTHLLTENRKQNMHNELMRFPTDFNQFYLKPFSIYGVI